MRKQQTAHEPREIVLGNQVVLSDEDQDEPTQQDIHEYAIWLGLDPVKDMDLMWIALEGIRAPLPENWKPIQSENNELYFFNFTTGESSWEHPLDQFYKDLAAKELKQKYEEKKTTASSSKGRDSARASKSGSRSGSRRTKKSVQINTGQGKLQPLFNSKLSFPSKSLIGPISDDSSDEGKRTSRVREDERLSQADLHRSDTDIFKDRERSRKPGNFFPSSSDSEEIDDATSSNYATSDDGRSNPLTKIERMTKKHLEEEEQEDPEEEEPSTKINEEVQELKREHEQYTVRNDELLGQIQINEKRNEELENELVNLQKSIDEAQRKNREELNRLELRNTNLVHEQNSMEEKIKSLHKQKEIVDKSIVEKKDSLNQIESELEQAKRSTQELNLTMVGRRQELDKIISECSMYKEESVRLQNDIRTSINELQRINNQRAEQKGLVDSLKRQEEEITKKISLRNQELSASKVRLFKTLRQVEQKARDQIRAMRTDLDKIQSDSKNFREIVTKESSEMMSQVQIAIVRMFNSQQERYESENRRLEVALERERSSKTELSQTLEKERLQFQNEKNSMEMKLQRLEEQLLQKNQELEEAKVQKQNVQSVADSFSSGSDNSTSSSSELEEWKEKCYESIGEETSRLQKAKLLVKSEKQKVKDQQILLKQAREEWKQDMTGYKDVKLEDINASNVLSVLKEVKRVLESQAERLNHEVKNLNKVSKWIRERMEKLSILKETVDQSSESIPLTIPKRVHIREESHYGSNEPVGFDKDDSPDIYLKMSENWGSFVSRHDMGIKLQILLGRDKLVLFKEQIMRRQEERLVEREILTQHIRWMKKAKQEMKRFRFSA